MGLLYWRTDRGVCIINQKFILHSYSTPVSTPESLQLPVTSLNRLLTILQLEVRDLSTRPAKRLETLGKDRVGVVVASVHPVRVHGAQVLDLQLEQGLGELLGIAEVLGEFIYICQFIAIMTKTREENLPAWNSNLRLRMFINSLITASIGARASENSKNPIMMGCSLKKPKDWYKDLLLIKTEKSANM